MIRTIDASKGRGDQLIDNNVWVVLIGLAWGVLFAWLSVAQYNAYNEGWADFAVMAQSIWSATQGEPLMHTSSLLGQSSRLNVHVELIYFLFAIPYRLWPDPRLLLALQGFLFGLGGIPVYSWVKRRLAHRAVASMFAGVYWLYPVAQSAVLYGFHSDTLAMPFLVFAMNALDARSWKAYIVGLVLALSCRFYIAIPLTVLGLLMLWEKDGQYGVPTAFGAALWGAVCFLVVRPWFAPVSPDQHSYITTLGYVRFYFAGALEAISTTYVLRLVTALVVLMPVLWLACYRWRWVLPAMSVLIPALASSGPPLSFSYRFHHYALAVPFLVLSAIKGAESLQAHPGMSRRFRLHDWRGSVFLSFATTAMLSVALVNTPLSPRFWHHSSSALLDPNTYGRTSRDRMKDGWLPQVIPPQARLAASPFLLSHFPNRANLYQGLPEDTEKVDCVLLDALFDRAVYANDRLVSVTHDLADIAAVLRNDDFGMVAQRDGLLVFVRDSSPEDRLRQEVQVLPYTIEHQIVAVNGPIALVGTELDQVGDRRYRMTYSWELIEPIANTAPLMAVTAMEGVRDARIVHLPTFALFPTTEWMPDTTIQETIEFDVPSDLDSGNYQLTVAWYDTAQPSAYLTDLQSVVGDEMVVGTVVVP